MKGMNNATPHTLFNNATMADTLHAMKLLALRGRTDLTIRRMVERICADVAEGDYASEVLAIYYFVKQRVRYMNDPDGVELLKAPLKTLETRSGDCDDIATLLATMLMSAGKAVRFAVGSFSSDRGRPVWSHVYVEVLTPHGVIVIDPVANSATKKMLKDMKTKMQVPVSDAGAATYDAGVGAFGKAVHVGPNDGKVYSVFDYGRGVYEYYEGALRSE